MIFDKLPLHDGVLNSISYEWSAASVCVKGRVSMSNILEEFNLSFFEVTELNLKQIKSWGESSQINRVWLEDFHRFNIEMQSGDVIVISAKSFAFNVLSGALANENN